MLCCCKIRICLLICWFFAFVQIANTTPKRSQLDSLTSLISSTNHNDSLYTNLCLSIARYYDDNNQFDSMQHWLNVGKDKLPVLDTQIVHFNYPAFQSIAYYYNGLLHMDLYESYKVLEIDANNFASGYLTTDINGDGAIDNLDAAFVEANANGFVGGIVP